MGVLLANRELSNVDWRGVQLEDALAEVTAATRIPFEIDPDVDAFRRVGDRRVWLSRRTITAEAAIALAASSLGLCHISDGTAVRIVTADRRRLYHALTGY